MCLFKTKFGNYFKRIVLNERDLMNRMNTMTQQTGIWSRFKTAVMQPSLSEQSIQNITQMRTKNKEFAK